MKTLRSSVFAALLLLITACSTVDSRMSDHKAAFDTWPAEVQEKVRTGKVDIGFNPEMVEVALGKPDRLSSRTTAAGQADVWVYFDKGPNFSIGFGVGSYNSSSAVGAGVTVGDDFRDEEKMRVIFEGGRVTAIEMRKS